MTTLIARPLPTAFDPASGPVSVATPSCCCCCCCCLNTAGAVLGATAGEAYYLAEEHDRSAGVMTAAVGLGLIAVPVAVIVALELSPRAGDAAIWIGAATYVVLTTMALLLAGAKIGQAVGFAAVVAALAGMATVAELFGALMTALFIELAAPLALWAGWRGSQQRSHHRQGGGGSGPMPPHHGDWRPPPPPPAGSFGSEWGLR